MPTPPKNTDALIAHEALNAMTTLRFLIEDDASAPELKREILDLLAWASFLVAHPDIFHSHPLPVFLAESNLDELLEIAMLLQEKNQQNKIERPSFLKNVLVQTDKNLSKDLLAKLLRFILEHCDQVEIKIQGNQLIFFHHQPKPLSLPLKNPTQCLSANKLSPFERLLACLLHQAPLLQMQVFSREKQVEVLFKPA